ncbi:hypothetical protein DQ04_01611060 [Trypanosoma grayi]|uniref:hypothetical protein n=1 Tax=Trypanosoma grayi TaxID=71804 RepID=UPI0004F4BC66|nr:hypothetical protein DQ04_01611060 [Trypanosoma grayi]KEG12564.1 hypothetical protein DQ04_01611060 [Trypanosoma grayi]
MMGRGQTVDVGKLPSATMGMTQPLEFVSTSGRHVVGNVHGVVYHGALSTSSGKAAAMSRRGDGTTRRRTGI